ncbi:hypothetical protein STEG23_022792, partial [Scotinomys teguina]
KMNTKEFQKHAMAISILLENSVEEETKPLSVKTLSRHCGSPVEEGAGSSDFSTASSAIKGAIQLGIGYTVGNLTSKPERDVLMQDFYVVESVFLPSRSDPSKHTEAYINYELDGLWLKLLDS